MEDGEDSVAANMDHCVDASYIKEILEKLPNVDPRELNTVIPG
jgi:hypothetical protein